MTGGRAIAVITATPPGFNPGMLVSELTAWAMLRRLGALGRARFLRLVPVEQRFALTDPADRAAAIARCDLGIDHAVLADPAELAETVPLFWGDFLHMRHYVGAIAALLPGGPDPAVARRFLLLEGAPDAVLRRAVSFGTTLLFNTASDLLDPAYGAALRRFAAGARLVAPRDLVSAARLRDLAPACGGACGLDCAQMAVLAEDWRDLFPRPPAKVAPHAGGLLFLGRARHEPAALDALLGRLGQGLGIGWEVLPWGDGSAFPMLVGQHQPQPACVAPPANPAPDLAALIGAVAGARLVVTDTYHLMVIAWSLGVPAVLLPGQSFNAPETGRDVNLGNLLAPIDKRVMFLARHGLLEFMLAPETLACARLRAAALDNMLGQIGDGRIVTNHLSELRSLAGAAEQALATALAEA